MPAVRSTRNSDAVNEEDMYIVAIGFNDMVFGFAVLKLYWSRAGDATYNSF